MQFDVPDNISYEAADFRYAAIIFKNFCTCSLSEGDDMNDACGGSETALIRYCAGNVTAPDAVCLQMIPTYYWATPVDEEGTATTTDYYTVAVVEIINTEWQGRIHALRLDIGEYNFAEALFSAIIIAIVTFVICMFGVWAGKKFGNMLSNKATVFGGVILVCIGIYIFVKGILGI